MKLVAMLLIVAPLLAQTTIGGGASMNGSANIGIAHWAQLTWDASPSPNVTGYNLYRATAAGGPYTKIGSTSGLAFRDTNVQAGQAYYYVATALDSSGNESDYSNEAAATIPAP